MSQSYTHVARVVLSHETSDGRQSASILTVTSHVVGIATAEELLIKVKSIA